MMLIPLSMSLEGGLVDFILKSATLLGYILKYQHRVLQNVILWLYRYGLGSIVFFNWGLGGWGRGRGAELFVETMYSSRFKMSS